MTESKVHAVAATGFDAGASAYAKARPGYPSQIFDALQEMHGTNPGRVLDVAAGTGKFTVDLARHFDRVIASEPVAGMRREFARLLPEVPMIAATAEQIPLADASVSLATVAQAFHWFDTNRALTELNRVLIAGGLLAVVFNIRDDSVDWVHRLWQALDKYDPDHVIPRHRERAWEPELETGELFEEARERLVIEHTQSMGIEDLLARVASVSFIASLEADEHDRVDELVRSLWSSDPDLLGKESFEYPYRCELTLMRRH